MRSITITTNTTALVTMFFSTLINATPVLEFDLDNMISQALAESNVVEIKYDFDSAFSVSPDLSVSAGSVAAFLAVSFNHAPLNPTSDVENSTHESTFQVHGGVETLAIAGNDGGQANARISSEALASSEMSTFLLENTGFGVNASSSAQGDSEAWAILTHESVSAGNKITSSGGSQSDSIALSNNNLSSFSTAASSVSTSSDAFVSGLHDLTRFFDGAASSEANGFAETFAMSAAQPTTLNQNAKPEGGVTDNNTFAFVRDMFLTTNNHANALANNLSQLLIESVDEQIESGSRVSSLGVSLSDTSAMLTDEHSLMLVNNAGFMSISSAEGFAEYRDSANFFSASNGVKTLAFGYTEVFVEKVPEPGSLSLMLLGVIFIITLLMPPSARYANAF